LGLAKIILGFDRRDLERLREENEKLWDAYARLAQKLEKTIYELGELGNRVRELEGENQSLRERVAEYEERLAAAEERIAALTGLVEALADRIARLEEQLEERSIVEEEHEPVAEEGEEAVTDDTVQIVYEKILEGVTSPTEIMEATGLSKRKVYQALKRLIAEGLVEKKREGRRVHYYPIHQAPTDTGSRAEALT